MGDVSPTNSTAEDEIVTFTVIRTSDAARKEVEMSISSTKLIDLKKKLAEDIYFGSKDAPVKRQRIFYLGRELKSMGRSLSNLGLGKFNNNILHLYIRPGKDGGDDDDDDDNNNKDINKEVSSTTAASASASAPPQKRRRKAERDEDYTERNNRQQQQQQNNIHSSRTSNTNANNAIDLLDSSDDDDDDEVEIIEVL